VFTDEGTPLPAKIREHRHRQKILHPVKIIAHAGKSTHGSKKKWYSLAVTTINPPAMLIICAPELTLSS
jgi:hypothetical protein